MLLEHGAEANIVNVEIGNELPSSQSIPTYSSSGDGMNYLFWNGANANALTHGEIRYANVTAWEGFRLATQGMASGRDYSRCLPEQTRISRARAFTIMENIICSDG